jgi:uncharacterized protein DUF642/PEP-CTERM motif-containing protein
MRQKALLAAVALVVFVVGAPMAFAAPNLVTNGSFETSDFTGWTEGGNFEATSVTFGGFYDYSGAEDGMWYAVLGPVGSDGTLSQTLTTTPGAHYTFSFWMASVGDDPSDFSASWDNNTLFSVSDPNTGAVWTQYTFSTTGTGSDTITFSFRDDPAWMALDNISVVQSGPATPEPSSLLLLGSGLLTVGGVIRRKLQANR